MGPPSPRLRHVPEATSAYAFIAREADKAVETVVFVRVVKRTEDRQVRPRVKTSVDRGVGSGVALSSQ